MPKQFTIHYACESLIPKRSSHVTAIGLCDIATKKRITFSLEDAEKTLGNQSDPSTLEAYLLKEFFAFVSDHLDAVWIHWHMDSVEYGFGVLKERFEMIWGEASPDITSTLNLPDKIFEKMQYHCSDYPKMYQLFQANGLKDDSICSGKEEAAYFRSGEYAAITHSTSAKSKALAVIYDKLEDQSLVTSCDRPELKWWVAGVLIFFAAIVYIALKGV
ncbi:hypothetical protein [Sulfurovum mangrovi]|uniref:hypothetical protein n=1 Tax=Sulfurovum mangrovi TaxID=2893889 RepID=UPI001E3C5C1C|nr:hypothetical protein [Sulfurovum mangrovi]UFH58548.1 hypothetical protein LN246_09310 [Sulfurovum mangrovi]